MSASTRWFRRKPSAPSVPCRRSSVDAFVDDSLDPMVDAVSTVDGLADDSIPSPARSSERIVHGWSPRRALEFETADQRAMEELAVDRRVVHQPRVGRDRLAAGYTNVGVVVALRDPAPLPVVLDALADHSTDGRVGYRSHQRLEGSREEQVVGIEETQPLTTDRRQAAVPRVRHTAVGWPPDEHDARVAFRECRHEIGRYRSRRRRRRQPSGCPSTRPGKCPLDGRRRVPGRHQDGESVLPADPRRGRGAAQPGCVLTRCRVGPTAGLPSGGYAASDSPAVRRWRRPDGQAPASLW
jgi:hypothetical protein